MSDDNKKFAGTADSSKNTADNKSKQKLDDEQRVKVLSPSMLVFKRFIRNRLAITGLIILIAMFLFSFLGGVLSPYSQAQVFRKYEYTNKDYATIAKNNELRYAAAEAQTFSTAAYAQLVLARNNDLNSFTADGNTYTFSEPSPDFIKISVFEKTATATGRKNIFVYKTVDGSALNPELQAAFEAANIAKQTEFEFGGDTYYIVEEGKEKAFGKAVPAALASKMIFDAASSDNSALVSSYEFRVAAEEAFLNGTRAFELNGANYVLEVDGAEDDSIIIDLMEGGNATHFATMSDLIINPSQADTFITPEFRTAASEAIAAGETSFTLTAEDGTETQYTLSGSGTTYTVQAPVLTQLIDMYAQPSWEHPLGTDSNGMDVMTRLMYGGRISLMVGFVVILIEMVIGIIIGGISGYFGGWVDTLLMRFLDLFNCIPFWPMVIIAGSIMDTMEIDPYARVFLLMVILGVLSWPGIARVVRGQILALREQDFMVATEATGIRISKRIFRHLVPNVMPLLIVQATMGLGSIIITEATLSYLGLGIKYPLASWGSIINAATNLYVMTNYWFIWIPAGFLILLTVLGFNFVGDGLRDAFDPKMKR